MQMRKGLFLTLPSLLWLTALFLIPMLIVFSLAFKPADPYGGVGEGWTLETFSELLQISYLAVIWRTLWLSALATGISLLFALPMGYYMARASKKRQQAILIAILLPFWSSFIIRVFAWKSLLHPEGLLKKLLVGINLVGADAVFLYRPSAVLLVMVYSFLPYAILPIYASAAKFDFSLIEAAMDLGMHRLKAFLKVFVPGIRRGVVTALMMVLIPALGSYVIPDVVGGPSSEMIGNKIVQRTFIARNLPQASALSALLALAILLPMGIIVLLQRREEAK